MRPGLMYLYLKRNWRAWLRIYSLKLKDSSLLSRLKNVVPEPNVIVSLTSIAPRIKSVEHTVRSILAGKVLPEAVCIYVDEKAYNLINTTSPFLKKLIDAGFLRVNSVVDVRSFTKYVYALQEYRDKHIVICDDDVLYPDYWLSELVAKKNKVNDNKVIICHRAHDVIFNSDGSVKPYSQWPKEVKSEDNSSILFPTGTGGVLYPPGCMPPVTYKSEAFLKVAPTADDIWFWLSAISNSCTFKLTDKTFNSIKFPEVPDSQASNLWALNVHQNANDKQMQSSLKYFFEENLLNAEAPSVRLLQQTRKFI